MTTFLVLLVFAVVLVLILAPPVRRRLVVTAESWAAPRAQRFGLRTARNLQRQALRQIKARAHVLVGGSLLPPQVIVYVSPSLLEELGPAASQFAREIEQLMVDATKPDPRTRQPSGFRLLTADPHVRLEADEAVPAGSVSVSAWVPGEMLAETARQIQDTDPTGPTEDATELMETEFEATEPGDRWLLDLDVAGERRIHTLTGTMLLGRSPEADIRVLHPGISREHAELRVKEEVVVRDLGSKNGVRVEGERVSEGTVAAGMMVQFAQEVCGTVLDAFDDALT